jgi:hypothetical protein
MVMKKIANGSSEQPEPLTTQRLCEIWDKVLTDPDARRALERLEKAGFLISNLKPNDAAFVHPTWADYITAIPLLPDKPSTRRIHFATSSRKYLPLIQDLRELANAVGPFRDVAIFAARDYSCGGSLREDLLKTASMLEHYLSWNYYTRHLNPRHALIAELRWTIRQRTGKPHDWELTVLLDAAFRAAGYAGFYMDSTALDRLEKRQRDSRVKATRRIREGINKFAQPLHDSTRIRRKSRKRV